MGIGIFTLVYNSETKDIAFNGNMPLSTVFKLMGSLIAQTLEQQAKAKKKLVEKKKNG